MVVIVWLQLRCLIEDKYINVNNPSESELMNK